MNASTDTPITAAAMAPPATPHPTRAFRMLLLREFWEHKGGFLWAPVIAGGISLLLTVMAIVVALVAGHRAAAAGELVVDGMVINGLDLAMLTSRMNAQDMAEFAQGINATLLLGSAWPFVVLAFVVFFYCLGTLYDERRDRSVLFWKSLPISDAQTVLSKVVSALVVAPVLAVLVSIATMFALMLILSVVIVTHGGNAWTLLWQPASPVWIISGHLAWLPVYALWALPTVGWLMLCSVWARSKPFLWALMVPLFAGLFVTWFGVMGMFGMQSNWFWGHVVGRLLLGTFPLSDLPYRSDMDFGGDLGMHGTLQTLSAGKHLGSLAMPELWIGAIVGAAMIFAAIRLRRWRDEG